LGELQFLDSPIVHAFGDIDAPQQHMRGAEVRSQLERLFDLGNGLVITTGEVEDHRNVHLRVWRDRVQPTRALGERERLLGPPHAGEIERIGTQGRLVVRVQFDGALEVAPAFGPTKVVVDRDRGQ
jgi:hypothetical protein